MARFRFVAATLTVFAAGFVAGQWFDGGSMPQAQGRKVFELRTYTSPEGKLNDLRRALSQRHAADLREARHGERRLLGADGRAGLEPTR